MLLGRETKVSGPGRFGELCSGPLGLYDGGHARRTHHVHRLPRVAYRVAALGQGDGVGRGTGRSDPMVRPAAGVRFRARGVAGPGPPLRAVPQRHGQEGTRFARRCHQLVQHGLRESAPLRTTDRAPGLRGDHGPAIARRGCQPPGRSALRPGASAPPPGGSPRKRATRPADAQQAVDDFWVVLGADRASSGRWGRRGGRSPENFIPASARPPGNGRPARRTARWSSRGRWPTPPTPKRWPPAGHPPWRP